MSPGITEETGLTARSIVSSLASTPMILAVLIFNVMYVGVTSYLFVDRNKQVETSELRWAQLVENAMKWCPAFSKQPEGPRLQSDDSHPAVPP